MKGNTCITMWDFERNKKEIKFFMNKKIVMSIIVFILGMLCFNISEAGYIENDSRNEKKILTSIMYLNNNEENSNLLTINSSTKDCN